MDSSATLKSHHHPKTLSKKLDSTREHRPPPPRSSRRTPSLSSSSSSFSPYNSSSSLESVLYFAPAHDGSDDPSPYSPARFSGGVPFSWEHLPGIPKKQTCNFKKKLIHQESSMKLLPLPPPTNTNTAINNTSSYNYSKKKNSLPSMFQRDPFFAAMVECSKGDEDYHEYEEKDELSSRNSSFSWNSKGRGSSGGSSNNNSNNQVSRSISDRFGFVNLYASCKNASAVSESIIYLPTSSSRRSRSNYHHFSRRRSL